MNNSPKMRQLIKYKSIPAECVSHAGSSASVFMNTIGKMCGDIVSSVTKIKMFKIHSEIVRLECKNKILEYRNKALKIQNEFDEYIAKKNGELCFQNAISEQIFYKRSVEKEQISQLLIEIHDLFEFVLESDDVELFEEWKYSLDYLCALNKRLATL